MRLKDVAEIKYAFSEKSIGSVSSSTGWITAGSLQANNVIGEIKYQEDAYQNPELLVQDKDILLKRIAPQYVNYVSYLEEEVYAGANLIIIRALPSFYSKFLAYILDTALQQLCHAAKGAVMPSIGRKELMEYDIGEPPTYEKQVAIGELWWLQKEKKKLMDEQNTKETSILLYKLEKATRR